MEHKLFHTIGDKFRLIVYFLILTLIASQYLYMLSY